MSLQAILDAERFLATLDPRASCFTFQTFDDDKKRHDCRLAQVLHGPLKGLAVELHHLNARHAGIFITVNETDFGGRTAKNIMRVRACFIDVDGGGPLPPLHRPPHMIVESSPQHWHVYWLVRELKIADFCSAQKRLIKYYNSDSIVHDLPRVMRLPGFAHCKQRPACPVRLVEAHDWPAYRPEMLLAGLPDLEKPKPLPPPRMMLPDTRRVRRLLQHVAMAPEGTRNATLYWAANRFRDMLGADLTEGEATSLLVQAACSAGLPLSEALATARSGLHGPRS